MRNKCGLCGIDIRFIIGGMIFSVFYLATAHDDLLETSNHAWLLLECIHGGQFSEFYNVVMSHQNTLYYLNNAHYNIMCYLLYALWQLPLYLVCCLTNCTINEYLLLLWSKAVGVIAYLGCGILTQKIAGAIESESPCETVALAFWLNPIAFFSSMIMAQYDSLCLLPLLLSILFWSKGRLKLFSITMGVAMVFKFFPLLLFLPLLVLVEKRPLHILLHGAMSLWLYIPTALLFRGRTGDMGVFTNMMIDEVFSAQLPGGIAPIPVFLTIYAVFLVGCYLKSSSINDAIKLMPWFGLFVYGSLFLFTRWHPQWLLLIVPFWILSTLQQKNQIPWYYVTILLFAGYWLCSAINYPKHFETGLLNNGAFRKLITLLPVQRNPVSFYFELIPHMNQLIPVLFYAPLLAAILFQFPVGNTSLGDKLSNNWSQQELNHSQGKSYLIWGCWATCIILIWLGSLILTIIAAIF